MAEQDPSADPGFGWPEVRATPAGAQLAGLLEQRDPADLDDAALVDALAASQRLANAYEGRVLALMGELDARRAAGPDRDTRDGRDLTPRAQTVTEVVAATRQPKGRVQTLLPLVQLLRTRLPRTWDLLQTGRLGGYPARIIAEQAYRLVDESLTGAVEDQILAALTADTTADTDDTEGVELVPATSSEVRTVATRVVAEAEPDQHQARHRRAYATRALTQHPDDGDGMGTLRLRHDTLTVQAIYHRLGLVAKHAFGADDPRTLDQQVADLTADLLLGRTAPVTTPTSALERGATPHLHDTGHGVTAQVHVTMTLASLAGYSDAPARLPDGAVIPASLARRIAAEPGSTWYRLLTDPAGHMLELSSQAYTPAPPVSRSVQAQHQTCVGIGCPRPAGQCDHDHERPWPHGPTAQHNLSPKCRSHHNHKTSGRFASSKYPDGTIAWTYPTGHVYTKHPPRHPVDTWPTDWVEPESLTQVQQGLAAQQRERRQRIRDRVADLRRRADERRLARWQAQEPLDPRDLDDDPDRPTVTPDDYAAARPHLAEMLG